MAYYQILYRITVEHDYFGENSKTILRYQLTRESMMLAKKCNLMFRQLGTNEWIILYDSENVTFDTEHDVLELELMYNDPYFILITDWKGINPTAANVLQLPTVKEEVDVVSACQSSNEMRSRGGSFCTVALHLTKEVLYAAQKGSPKSTTLCFHAPLMQWEYLFSERGNANIPLEELRLEEIMGRVKFSAFTIHEEYGRTFFRTVSEEAIPMRSTYDLHFRLLAFPDNRQQKRILHSRIEPPTLGRFQSGMPNILREISYF